jgi:hypothetical protein
MQRRVHVLSLQELWVLLIVLYCPWLWELQEQRMLPILPTPHPMASHRRAVGMVLPAMRGTLAVADELGILRWHPFLTLEQDGNSPPTDIPTPWIGDMLLFLMDEIGPFCTNLSVKATLEGFLRRTVNVTPNTNLKRSEEHEKARQEVEQVLYGEAGIPTHQVAGDELDQVVVANLKQIIAYQRRKVPLSSQERIDIVSSLHDGMKAGKSALEVLRTLTGTDQQRFYYAKSVMYQAIWQRQLRIDLFQYFFVDQPMIPESRDVLDIYGAWFQRPQP